MKRLHRILVYANESSHQEAAVRRAGELATRNEASLTLVDVLPVATGGLTWSWLAGPTSSRLW